MMTDKPRDNVISPKVFVRIVIDSMPDNATFAELVEEIRLAVALEESAQDLREGRVVSDAEVRERMRSKRKWN